MITHSATHATLLARVRDGHDASAWGDFCDRYGALIRAFCRRRGLADADTDDVQQDVLLSLSKAMPRFRYDPALGKFRSYLKTVVLHAIFLRARQNKPAAPLDDIEEATRAAAGDPGIDSHWEAEWRQHHLRTAMRSLRAEAGENDIAAFERYAVRGESPHQVAAALSMSLDQVYQAKSRLLRRLSALIEQQVAEEG